jgi:stage V sporulation protein K
VTDTGGYGVQISLKFKEPGAEAAQEQLPQPRYDQFHINQAFAGMIGLEEAKRNMMEICAFSVMQKKRREQAIKAQANTLHMVFKGAPGTGKTSAARIYGQLLRDIGLLSKGHLLEIERADLVGEYIGHTAIKTRELVKKALGGVLFIDEAYSLGQGGDKDFGQEAVAALVKAMEDHKDNFVVILAGYTREMEYFIQSNPGLRSRFPIQIRFADYGPEELFAIALQMYADREYILSSRARWKLKTLIEQGLMPEIEAGNARTVRNLVERSIRMQALRLLNKVHYTKRDMVLIEDMDLEMR